MFSFQKLKSHLISINVRSQAVPACLEDSVRIGNIQFVNTLQAIYTFFIKKFFTTRKNLKTKSSYDPHKLKLMDYTSLITLYNM